MHISTLAQTHHKCDTVEEHSEQTYVILKVQLSRHAIILVLTVAACNLIQSNTIPEQ